MSEYPVYLVAYDIKNPKRLRRVFRLLEGYGEWIQLSVFQCRLSDRRRQRLIAELHQEINLQDDHVLIFRLGTGAEVEAETISMGKPFEPVSLQPLIV